MRPTWNPFRRAILHHGRSAPIQTINDRSAAAEARSGVATRRLLIRSSGQEAVMSDTKHEKSESPFPDDLERDPGIGQSKGSFMTSEDPHSVAGENTVEGDVDNDSTGGDGVPERKRERTNN
jgi:hypothetical protein